MPQTPKGAHEFKRESRWGQTFSLAGLSASMLLSSLGTSIANVGLPPLQTAFSASFQHVQWIVLSYLLAITTLIVSAGRLGDMFGRRRMLILGLATFVIASGLCGLAPSLWLLIIARGLQGMGAALMMSLSMAMIGSAVPPERTGRAMGLLGTMSAIGTALGPSLGGILLSQFGWRSIFIVLVPLGVATLWVAIRALPMDGTSNQKAKFDLTGTFILALALGTYALAMTVNRSSFGIESLSLLSLSMLLVVLFLFVESRITAPLLDLSQFRDMRLNSSLVMSLLVSTVIMSTLVVGPFYLKHGLELSDAAVGMVMSFGPVLSAITGIVAGRLVDRFGASLAVMAGLAIMLAGTVALCSLPAHFGVAGYIASMVVLTPGYQLFQASNNTAIMKEVRSDRRGVVSGLLNLSRNLGLVTGASLMGALFAFGMGKGDVSIAAPEAIGTGLRFTFFIAALFLVVAFAIAVFNAYGRHDKRAM